MKRLIALLTFSVSISSCYYNVCNAQNLKAIQVTFVSPVMGQVQYRIYNNKDLVMYQSQYFFDSSIIHELSSKSETIHQVRNTYFVFHKDSSYGYVFNPLDLKCSRINVQAKLDLIKGSNRFDSFLTLKPDTIAWTNNKKELREVYLYPTQADIIKGQVNLFYSSKLNHLSESLNNKVDKAKRMKLYKIENIISYYPDKTDISIIKVAKDSTELKEITVDNPKEIESYFQMYRKCIAKEK